MGTSSSSAGPGGDVPFDPPWLDDIANSQPDGGVQDDDQGNGDSQNVDQENNGSQEPDQSPAQPPDLAPPRRFYNARRELGVFARTGNEESFRKAIGHYSRTGMGGARKAASRMRASTRSAANFFGVLQSAREGSDPTINQWVSSLSERHLSAQDVIDEIIRQVAPSGGSLDEASCRESMAQAMHDLMEEYPDIDLLHLGDGNIWTVIESFLGYEAFSRLCLDIGKIFEKSALNPRVTVTRMNEMQEYLKAELAAQIEELRTSTQNPTSAQLQALLQSAVQNTFLVYEGAI